MSRILMYNKPEWPFMIFGLLFSILNGMVPIVFSIIIAQILAVSTFYWHVACVLFICYFLILSCESVSIINVQSWKANIGPYLIVRSYHRCSFFVYTQDYKTKVKILSIKRSINATEGSSCMIFLSFKVAKIMQHVLYF